jgi:thiamine-phosphate pyrophosphorylase
VRIGRLQILTDTSLQSRFSHADLARLAIRGGADLIQFRQKTGSTREMILAARKAREVCRKAHVPFIVNDRIDVAIAVDADGIHLGWDDFPLEQARMLLGPHRIIGASAGSVDEALAGWRQGADYLGCGPFAATASKPDAGPAAGVALLRAVVAAVPIPVVAIGGISQENVAEVLASGVYGVAVISAVCCGPDPEGSARALRGAIDERPQNSGAGAR